MKSKQNRTGQVRHYNKVHKVNRKVCQHTQNRGEGGVGIVHHRSIACWHGSSENEGSPSQHTESWQQQQTQQQTHLQPSQVVRQGPRFGPDGRVCPSQQEDLHRLDAVVEASLMDGHPACDTFNSSKQCLFCSEVMLGMFSLIIGDIHIHYTLMMLMVHMAWIRTNVV